MTLVVDTMKNDDIDRVLEIENALYKNPYKRKDFEYELNENPFSYYFVVKIKETNEIIGYIGFWITYETSQITKISIDKKYQGHGISKILMEDMITRVTLAKCENVSLEVRVSNTIAYSLYKSYGFKDATIRKRYYEDGEDAILMIKELI